MVHLSPTVGLSSCAAISKRSLASTAPQFKCGGKERRLPTGAKREKVVQGVSLSSEFKKEKATVDGFRNRGASSFRFLEQKDLS